MEIAKVQAPISALPVIPAAVADVVAIPTEFIRSETEQPAMTTVKDSVLEVPTIDMSGNKSSSSSAQLVEAIVKASSEWGMFQVINHGIPEQVISRMQQAGKEFFSLPQEEKMKYANDVKEKNKQPPPLPSDGKSSSPISSSKHPSVEGYWANIQLSSTSIPDSTKAWNDHLFHKIWPPSSINHKFWPQNPSFYREANEVYCEYLRKVAERLFGCLSVGLGLEETAMVEASGGNELEYLMKINYYPKCPRPDLVLGVAAHTDMSTLTILVPNEVPGLQVFREERWYDVKYIPNALIIHIGDQIEIMSNGKYKAVKHRTTVSSEKVRMSWPVFLEPPPDKEIGPLVANAAPPADNNNNSNGKIDDDEDDNKNNLIKPKYKTKKYSDYVYCKLNKIPQ